MSALRAPALRTRQFDGGRAEQVLHRHFGVVRVEPRVLVARRADELRGRAVVRAGTDPLDRQTGARNDPGGDLGQFGQRVDGQRPGRQHPVGRGVVDHGAVGAHRHWRESEPVDHRRNPPRRTTGGQHELSRRRNRRAHRVTGARGDFFVGVEQGAVNVAGDQRGQFICRPLCPTLLAAGESMRSALALSRAGDAIGPVPSRRSCNSFDRIAWESSARRRATAQAAAAPNTRLPGAGTPPAPGTVTRSSPAQGDVEFSRRSRAGAAGGRRRQRDRNPVAEQLLFDDPWARCGGLPRRSAG